MTLIKHLFERGMKPCLNRLHSFVLFLPVVTEKCSSFSSSFHFLFSFDRFNMYCHSVFALWLCWPVKNVDRDNDTKAAIYHLCVERMGDSLVHQAKNGWTVSFYKNII